MMTEAIYKKVGRKYVPIAARWYEDSRTDQMDVGTFRLTYVNKEGCRRYEYQVTPATAPAVAAMMVARVAMEAVISEKSKYHPSTGAKPYTKRQLALIEQFRAEMGMSYPAHWMSSDAHDISKAAIKAVMEFAP